MPNRILKWDWPSVVAKWVNPYIQYPHQLQRKIKWPSAIVRLTAHFTYGLMSDLVICKPKKSMAIHDTEYPYWVQVSLNNWNSKFRRIVIHIKLKCVDVSGQWPTRSTSLRWCRCRGPVQSWYSGGGLSWLQSHRTIHHSRYGNIGHVWGAVEFLCWRWGGG